MSNSRWTGKSLRCSVVVAVAAACLPRYYGWAAESKPETNAPPSRPSPAPTSSLAAFRLKPGFRMELVASEPLIAAPVAMAFDENGRLFVVERPEPSGARATNAPAGRVRLLEDAEGAGEFHASTIYADNLPWASAVACYAGGVFVAAGPDVIYLKDTRTNGIADVRRVVFTGLADTNTPGAPALPNNFNWGLDNRIHAASPGVPGALPPASGCFCFDPRALTLAVDAGPAQSGLTFDNWGRELVCDFARPLRLVLFPPRYRARNPFFAAPPEMADVASPATAVFRLAPVELPLPAAASPTATTRPTAQVTNVLVATWLTNAQGCVVYRGSAFPSSYLGNAFVADPSAHVIHRMVLREAGLQMAASRAPDEPRAEFLMAPDAAFRPVQIVNGPGGALYVVDHQHGGDRGRIYRIAPEGAKPFRPPRFSKATTPALVAALADPDGWQRETAARLLYERRDPVAVPLLVDLLGSSQAPLTRLHALYALDGLGALNQAALLKGLRDADQRVREHAVLLSEHLARSGALPDPIWNQLRLLTSDSSLRVSYQLALTLGEFRRPDRAQVIANLLLRPPENPWIQAAVLSSLAEGAGELFVILASDARVRGSAVGQEWLPRLAAMIGLKDQPAEVAQVVAFADPARLTALQAFSFLPAFGEGLRRAGSSVAQADPQGRLQRFNTDAANALLGAAASEPLRLEAIRWLSVCTATFNETSDLLLLPLGSGQSEAIQSAAIATLGSYDDARVTPALVGRWRVLTPRLRAEAVSALLSRSERAATVLDAMERGNINSANLSAIQVNLLRTWKDPAVAERAVRLFGPLSPRRPGVEERFRPALALKGVPNRGQDIYLTRCAACHQPASARSAIGPDLTTARILGRERVFTAILDPDAKVRSGWETYVMETAAGEVLWGLLRDENTMTITMQPPSGAPRVLSRANVQYLQSQPWSLMPEGLEEGLAPQALADLLAYLVPAPL